jgi:hypothetical protein
LVGDLFEQYDYIPKTKLRIHNITAKAALKFGSEAWVLKKREEQRLEAAQIKFLRHLLGITKLDKEKTKVSLCRSYLNRYCMRRKAAFFSPGI